jgi:coproporphyrinogen III oxidase
MAAIASQSTPSIAQKKTDASDWFRTLRDEICVVFEAIEDAGRDDDRPAGRFARKNWQRDGGGGGEISLMHGRVFEKVGVNISTVFGTFSDDFKGQISGAEDDGQFWASWHLIGGAYAQSACTSCPHEYKIHRDLEKLVWRWWRFNPAFARCGGGH